MKKEVIVTFRMEINDGTEIDFITPGLLTVYDHVKELVFDERLEGSVRTSVSIYPEKVTIKRTGDVRMDQEFIVGRTTNMHLETSFGLEITMATETDAISDDDGELLIIYETDSGNATMRAHRLCIRYE